MKRDWRNIVYPATRPETGLGRLAMSLLKHRSLHRLQWVRMIRNAWIPYSLPPSNRFLAHRRCVRRLEGMMLAAGHQLALQHSPIIAIHLRASPPRVNAGLCLSGRATLRLRDGQSAQPSHGDSRCAGQRARAAVTYEAVCYAGFLRQPWRW
jgi:hypothetical protein